MTNTVTYHIGVAGHGWLLSRHFMRKTTTIDSYYILDCITAGPAHDTCRITGLFGVYCDTEISHDEIALLTLQGKIIL